MLCGLCFSCCSRLLLGSGLGLGRGFPGGFGSGYGRAPRLLCLGSLPDLLIPLSALRFLCRMAYRLFLGLAAGLLFILPAAGLGLRLALCLLLGPDHRIGAHSHRVATRVAFGQVAKLLAHDGGDRSVRRLPADDQLGPVQAGLSVTQPRQKFQARFGHLGPLLRAGRLDVHAIDQPGIWEQLCRSQRQIRFRGFVRHVPLEADFPFSSNRSPVELRFGRHIDDNLEIEFTGAVRRGPQFVANGLGHLLVLGDRRKIQCAVVHRDLPVIELGKARHAGNHAGLPALRSSGAELQSVGDLQLRKTRRSRFGQCRARCLARHISTQQHRFTVDCGGNSIGADRLDRRFTELDLLLDADRVRYPISERAAQCCGRFLFGRQSRQLELIFLEVDRPFLELSQFFEGPDGGDHEVRGLTRRDPHAIDDDPMGERLLSRGEYFLARPLAWHETAKLKLCRRQSRAPEIRLDHRRGDFVALQCDALRQAACQCGRDRPIGGEVLRLAGHGQTIRIKFDACTRLQSGELLEAEADGAQPHLRLRRAPRQLHPVLDLELWERRLGRADDGLPGHLVGNETSQPQPVLAQQRSPDVVLLLLDELSAVFNGPNTPYGMRDLEGVALLLLIGGLTGQPSVAA